jgi:hypothetical protein
MTFMERVSSVLEYVVTKSLL